jgi:hypothetical protein
MVKIGFQLISALKVGHELSQSGAWKRKQVWVNLLTGLVAIAFSFGIEIPLMESDIVLLSGAIVAVLNVVLTMATSKKVGMPNRELPPIDLVAESESDELRGDATGTTEPELHPRTDAENRRVGRWDASGFGDR